MEYNDRTLMNKTIPVLLAIFIAFSGLTLASCSEDEPNYSQEPAPPIDELAELQKSLTREDAQGNLTERVFGVALDPATPTVVSVGVENFDEAREIFASLFSDATHISDDGLTASFTTRQGRAVLVPVNDEEGVVAKAEFDVDGLRFVTCMRFITNSAWPENDGSPKIYEYGKRYYFYPWTQNIGKVNGTYLETFVCIREYNNGVPALLVGLSEKGIKLDTPQLDAGGNMPGKSMAEDIQKIISSNYNYFKQAFNGDGKVLLDDNRVYWTKRSYVFGHYTISLKSGKWTKHTSDHSYNVLFYMLAGGKM